MATYTELAGQCHDNCKRWVKLAKQSRLLGDIKYHAIYLLYAAECRESYIDCMSEAKAGR